MKPQKSVLLVSAYNSTFTYPLKTAFEKNGFTVHLFDYRYILGNLIFNPVFCLSNFSQLLLQMLIRNNFSHKYFLNRMLIDLAKTLRPSYLFVVKGETITAETIESINSYNTITMLWQVDPTFAPPIWDYVKRVGRKYQIYISCEPGSVIKKLKKVGFKRVVYMLGAADESQIRTNCDHNYIYDISLVGTYHPIRELYLEALKGLDVHVWGWGEWKTSKVAEMFEGYALTQKEMLNVYSKSKIVINVGRAIGSTIPTNLRPFEAAQVGAFILVNHTPNLSQVFKIGKEIDTFKTPQELKKKVIYYLQHQDIKEKMALALLRRVKKDHTYKKRVSVLLKQIYINDNMPIH